MSELRALALRAVACRAWRWMPGMLAWGGRLVLAVDGAGRPDVWAVVPDGLGEHVVTTSRGDIGWVREGVWSGDTWDDSPPALSDPATIGCLLGLVREAWSHPEAVCVPVEYGPEHDAAPWWYVYDADYTQLGTGGATEAEALVAALEAAPTRP